MAIRPNYRLQVLVDMRERKKEEAERHLGECMKALKAAQDRLHELQQELERMVAKREAKVREYSEKTMRGEMSAQDAVNAKVFIERLKLQEANQKNIIEGQKAVIAQRKEEVDAARQDLIVANQDLKALEKHKEKWQEKVKKDREAKEEDIMDEIAQTIHRTGGSV